MGSESVLVRLSDDEGKVNVCVVKENGHHDEVKGNDHHHEGMENGIYVGSFLFWGFHGHLQACCSQLLPFCQDPHPNQSSISCLPFHTLGNGQKHPLHLCDLRTQRKHNPCFG